MARRPVYNSAQHDLFKPESDWTPPSSPPDIPSGVRIAIDTETCDKGLQQRMGPGWVSRNGWLCGVSYAWSGGAGYLPTRHPDTACLDEDVVLAWLADLCARCDVVFQNAGYDIGWTGVPTPRRFDDTQTMGVLLDENRYEYNLDALCVWQGVAGKDEALLREAVLTHGGMGYAKEFHVERLLREVILTRIAPVTEQMILSFIGENVLGLPKSY